MQFRPCIDLKDGKVVQIVGATLKDGDNTVTNFVSSKDALFFAELFYGDVLSGGHIIMLDNKSQAAALKVLKKYPDFFQIGGGITPETAMSYISAGASHIIVTSYIFSDATIDFSKVELISKIVTPEKLVLDLSCRKVGDKFTIVCDKWGRDTGVILDEKLLDALSPFCDEFLIHAIDVEGAKSGIQNELVVMLSGWLKKSKAHRQITYAGGVHSVSDIELIKGNSDGKLNFTIGSALDIFGGNEVKYEEVIAWLKSHPSSVGRAHHS